MTVGNVFIYYCKFENMRFSPSFHEVEVLDIKALRTGGWNPKAKKKGAEASGGHSMKEYP